MNEKFNYQFVFKIGEDDFIIFTGVTQSKCLEKLSDIQAKLREFLGKDKIVVQNIAYTPITDGKKETTKE